MCYAPLPPLIDRPIAPLGDSLARAKVTEGKGRKGKEIKGEKSWQKRGGKAYRP